MASKKIQLYTDRANTIEASPETSANCVILSDGNDLQKVLDNDLTNPTVVHEETSFKVGAGDIDVSSSVVDGEVGRMVIKGKTYQNILPEPSTHVLTNNKEMFKVNEGLDPNVEIVDGVSKSAILSGRTLVNLATKTWAMGSTAQFNKDTTTLTTNTDKAWFSTTLKTVGMKAGGTYLLYTDSITYDASLSSSSNLASLVSLYEMKPNRNVGRFISNGAVKVTIPSDVDASDIGIRIHATLDEGTGGVGKTTTVKGLMIFEYQEGMENWDIPYIEGMTSCKMPVLTTTGKNLFKPFRTYTTKGLTFTITNGQLYVDGTATETVDYYLTTKGNDGGMYDFINNNIPVGATLTLSNNLGLRNHFGYYLDGVEKDYWANESLAIESNTSNIRCFVRFPTGQSFSNQPLNIQLEQGTVATSYEPYKTNILSTPEEVVLREVNGVKDTLNLNTGEYVQRIGEINLSTSSSAMWWQSGYTNDALLSVGSGSFTSLKASSFLICNVLPSQKGQYNVLYNIDFDSEKNLRINVPKTIANDVSGFMSWLKSNNVIIVGELETPVVKTVDLSSSGNWEKVVLDGSEDWGADGDYYCFCRNLQINSVCTFTDSIPVLPTKTNSLPSHASFSGARYFTVLIDGILNDPVKLKQYLAQNPMTVWYQTTTHQDSTQVKQPIFFKDGHIQLSSGADSSLIPTLDYQAKTSNSYVMDLMKANTRYTMKAKSASGNFTLGGSSYSLGTNRVFSTTGAEFNANNMMVITGSCEDLMILEGELTSKTIPYFKGIKSAFEDESKIEVLSTSKNLWSNSYFRPHETVMISGKECISFDSVSCQDKPLDKPFFVNKDKYYRISGEFVKTRTNGETQYFGIAIQINGAKYGQSNAVLYVLGNGAQPLNQFYRNGVTCKFPESGWVTSLSVVNYGNTNLKDINVVADSLLLEELNTPVNNGDIYVEHKSNNTKIPLLSPLRSLPNGVCDELIVDRMKKKATLIQRIKSTVFNGSEGWNLNGYSHDKLVEFVCHSGVQMAHTVFSDRFITGGENVERVAFSGGSIYIRILKTKVSNVDSFKKWLSQNPLTVQYGLQTPLITEIDLESFPLVYKDGHIFLNSEIAPVVEIDYNVNQSQQIQSNNETLQRHELDILDLDNLIVSFVNAEYNLRLLKFDMELSMMALAE